MCVYSAGRLWPLQDFGLSGARDVMKISTVIILLFLVLVLIVGCSDSCSCKEELSLWGKRQMDDDQRIYGNPHESRDRWEGFHNNRD